MCRPGQYREQHLNDKKRNAEGTCELKLTPSLLYLRSPDKQRAIPLHDIQDLQVNSSSAARVRYLMRMRLRPLPPVVYVFEFTCEDDLELFKTQLSQRLVKTSTPAIKQEVMSETERKQRAALLAANPNTLKRQYTDMVTRGLISESDFWNLNCRKQMLVSEAEKRQKIGKTSEILTDVQGQNQTGEKTEVKYNLNPEIIHQIFVQYPVVYMAYQELVPDQIDGIEFWTKFVQSKYAHRDRLKQQQSGVEDLFTKYEKKWQQEQKIQSVQGTVDPLIDLTATENDDIVLSVAQNAAKVMMTDTNIAKFNRHAADVLSAAAPSIKKKTKKTMQTSITEAITIEDLEEPTRVPYIPLNLDNTSRYFEHNENTAQHGNQTYKIEPAQRAFERMFMEPPSLKSAFPQSSISAITKEILANCNQDPSNDNNTNIRSEKLAQAIPENHKESLTKLFHDVNELLRHYFGFEKMVATDGSPEARLKLERIKAKMGEKYEEVADKRQKLPPAERTSLGPIFYHFTEQLNTAFVEE
ncbi:general transcription factor IIH subunit [Thraustotheca clavata]|uniref:General transcription factor IIH subunit n=1 Tax=Thraustotheca clavata TaxID=74557 RepID=A0A1W0AC24_9STRA|nr:general transcription factor IIH subunit [Thraustotheca clavata]